MAFQMRRGLLSRLGVLYEMQKRVGKMTRPHRLREAQHSLDLDLFRDRHRSTAMSQLPNMVQIMVLLQATAVALLSSALMLPCLANTAYIDGICLSHVFATPPLCTAIIEG